MKTAAWAEIRDKCAACGHKGWCTQSADGTVILCRRLESRTAVKQRDGSPAWLHHVKDLGISAVPAKAKKERPRLGLSELRDRLKQNHTAINPRKLVALSNSLCVSIKSLTRYGIGWDNSTGAWSFPMYDYDASRKSIVPCGISLRWGNGEKKAVPGSRNGLFVPDDYVVSDGEYPLPLMLLMPEGATDCCAAADLGFRAIGRPSCSGGVDHIQRLLAGMQIPQELVVIGERDGFRPMPGGMVFYPGIEGALGLCRSLNSAHRTRFVLPPEKHKDLRDWKQAGATTADVLALVQAAPIVTAQWMVAADKRMEEKKKHAAMAA